VFKWRRVVIFDHLLPNLQLPSLNNRRILCIQRSPCSESDPKTMALFQPFPGIANPRSKETRIDHRPAYLLTRHIRESLP
jgi:hypothetical protein